MTHLPILPEMLEAGQAALQESRAQNLSDLQMLVDIYLAMEGMKIIIAMRERYGSVLH